MTLLDEYKKAKATNAGGPVAGPVKGTTSGSKLLAEYQATKQKNAQAATVPTPEIKEAVMATIGKEAPRTEKPSKWGLLANTKFIQEAAAGIEAAGETPGSYIAKDIFRNYKAVFNTVVERLANTKLFKEAAAGYEAMDRGEIQGTTLDYLAPELLKNLKEIGAGFAGRGTANVLDTMIAAPANFTTRMIYGKSNPIGDFVGDFAEEMRKEFTTETAQKMAETPFSLQKAFDPDFWMTTVAENVPVTLGFMRAAAITRRATLGAGTRLFGTGRFAQIASQTAADVTGSTTMRAFESSAEAEETYKQAKDRGMSEDAAIEASRKVFVDNMKLVGVDAVQVALAFSPIKFGGSSIFRKIIAETAKLAVGGASEGGEEVYQYRAQQLALGEDFSFADPQAREAGFIGAVMGVFFQAGGRIDQAAQERMKNKYMDDVIEKLPPSVPPPPGGAGAAAAPDKEKYLERVAQEQPEAIEAAVTAIEEEHQKSVQAAREATELLNNLDIPGIIERGEDDVLSQVEEAAGAVAAPEEGDTTQPEELSDKIEEVLGELSDSEEAMQDWQENNADQFAELGERLSNIEKKIAETKNKTEKKTLIEEATKISNQMAKMENDFVDKYREKARKIVEEQAPVENARKAARMVAQPEERQEEAPEGEISPPKDGYTRYEVEVDGVKIAADYNPKSFAGNKHIEFQTVGPNPISETGYRSHFMHGEPLDDSPEALQAELQKVAERLAAEEKPRREKAARAQKALDKKKEKEDDLTHGKRDRDTGGEIRPDTDTERDEDVREEPAKRGGADTKHRGRMARGKGGTGDTGARERPSNKRVAWSKLLRDFHSQLFTLKDAYGTSSWQILGEQDAGFRAYVEKRKLSVGTKDISLTDVDAMKRGDERRKPSPIVQKVEMPEKKGRVRTYALEAESGARAMVEADFYDELEKFFGAAPLLHQSDTPLRFMDGETIVGLLMPILSEESELEKALGPKAEETLQKEAEEEMEEKREAIGTTNEEIEQLVQASVEIQDGIVRIKEGVELTEEELRKINTYTGAGGKEKKGAEGRGLLDEYYTPPDVTTMVSGLLSRLGAFASEDIRVLEPSAGTGAFLGGIPSIGGNTFSHEINPTAAGILKLNHPETNVSTSPFESMFMTDRGVPKDTAADYDLVIGNPPYGTHRGKYKGLGEEPKIERYEEYFLKRSLDVTKDGGYVAMVIPSGFLRGQTFNHAKEMISKHATLVAAYRLPNGAFPTTDIGTDIVVFKKGEKETRPTLINDNYFKENPSHILGEEGIRKGKFGEEAFVAGTLEAAANRFYQIVNDEYAQTQSDDPDVRDGVANDLEQSYKPAVYKETKKKQAAAEPKEATSEMTNVLIPGGKYRVSVVQFPAGTWGYVGSVPRELTKEVENKSLAGGEDQRTSLSFKTKEEAEERLREYLASQKNKRSIATSKSEGKRLALSQYSTATKEEAELWKYVQPTGELKGEFKKEDAYFYKGEYYNEFNYLQGDIYEKLDQLELDKKQLSEEQYAKQKKALQGVLPEPVGIERMVITPNSRFAHDFLITMKKPLEEDPDAPAEEKSLAEHFSDWLSTLPMTAFGESSVYSVRGYINSTPVRGGDKVQNEAERRTRRTEGDRLFKLFLRENLAPKQKKEVEDQYNRQFNSYARPNYRAVPLISEVNAEFKGRPLEIRDVQLQGVGFLLNRGVGLLAHDVGVGKTMQIILAVGETLNKGWAKKPLIVVPSPNVYNQWVREIGELLPGVRINLLSNLGGDFKGELKTLEIPDGSISIVTEEGFKKLGFKNETYDDLTADFLDVIEDPNGGTTKRAGAKAMAKAEEEVAKGIKGTTDERFFEDLGFDLIAVDEVHNANHIIASAKADNKNKVSEFRGFQTKPSQFGIKTWLAAQYIQKKMGGRNVYLASATPFTNNPLEYYSILSLMARERMKRMGILNVNDFMTAFMEIEVRHEFKADGSYVEKPEVRGIKNYQQFQKLLTEFIDFRDGVEAGVVRPDRVSKEYVVGRTADQVKYAEMTQELFADKENAGTLKAIGELRAAAFSPYLSRYHQGGIPGADEFIKNSPKLRAMVEIVKQSLKDNPEGGHLIYSPVGVEFFPLIKEALVGATGLSKNEIDIISGSTPRAKRASIQEGFNKGEIKIVLGSDAIQEGVNLQENTTDLHIMSLPWNFTQVRQVIGRAWRQGNKWPRVRINTYFTENSVDVFLSQKLQNKESRYEATLQFKGDELDVGDINFEEMKMDLITDPVRRAQLEFELKEKELQLEIKRKEADAGYKNRRAAELVEAMDRLASAKETAAKHPEEEWPKFYVKQYTERLEQVRTKLKDRGIDVDDIEREVEEAQKEVEALRKKITDLQAEKETVMKQAAAERMLVSEVAETDFDAFVKERAEENKTFYERDDAGVKMAVAPITAQDKWQDAIDIELTGEEREAVTLITMPSFKAAPADIQKTVQKRVKSAYDKYLAFVKRTEKLAAEARRIGEPFDVSEEQGRAIIESLFDPSEVKFLTKKNDLLVFRGDTQAWGAYTPSRMWQHPMIKVVANRGMVQSKVLYHEAFHAYMDNFVEPEERERILESVRKNPVLWLMLKRYPAAYSKEEIAEEWLANDFARYVAGQQSASENKGFYEKILEKIREWVRKITGAQLVYDAILQKKRDLKPDPVARRIRVASENRAKLKVAEIPEEDRDFTIELAEERKAGFETIAENVKPDMNRDLIRKDINTIEDLTAQARDIYLKDPNEFGAAKDFENAADQRRMKKAALDAFYSKMMEPYFKEISQGEREKVNKVLMQGDFEATEYTDEELKNKNLSAAGIAAYKGVRKAFNTAHNVLIQEMRRNGVPDSEIADFEKQRAGYMPHKWRYPYVVKHQVRKKEDGSWYTYQMDNFKSESQAREAWENLKANNTRSDVRYSLDTLDNLEVDFFTEQRLSFDSIRSVLVNARTSDDVKKAMIDALRNMVKEKGFGRHYMRRTGTRGYEQKEVPKLIADYFSGMNGYITKMEAGKRYFEALSTIDARRQARFHSWLRDMIAYDMGNTKEWQWARSWAFIYYLANDISFLLTNATQNFIVGTGELSKYMTGAQKIVGPELRIMKAMTDWSIGNVSPEERKAIESLLKLGRLGGEMTAELMGFKNNPLYTEISSRFNKIMYASTAFVESNVNRVPMFLAARRLFIEQGMGEKQANEKALEVSDDIHFRYGKQNRPRFERGHIGTLFVFYHYMRSLLYQLWRDASHKEYAAFSRKMLYTALIGGTVSLPFAKSLIALWRLIFGVSCDVGDEEACDLGAEMPKWQIALEKGLPALTGIDLSGRVGIDLMSVQSIMEDPNDIRSYIGAFGNLIWFNPKGAAEGGRLQQSLELMRQGRIEDGLGKMLPDMFANFFKAYSGYQWGVRSFAGTPLEDANGDVFKYNTWEAIIRATGFTPTRESLLWDAKSKQFTLDEAAQSERTRLRRTIQGMVQRGEYAEARAAQATAIEEGIISEQTNYIREFGKETFIKDALDDWAKLPHDAPTLRRLENDIITAIYGTEATDVQKLNIRKEFAVYRIFGTSNDLVEKLDKAITNEDKVEILIKARSEMGVDALTAFLKDGRRTVKTEAGNESYILISDELLEAYKKAVQKL